MMQFIAEYGLFLAKTATIVVAIAIILMMSMAIGLKQRRKRQSFVEVEHINEQYEDMAKSIAYATLDEDAIKRRTKEEDKAQKAKSKAEKKQRKLEEKEREKEKDKNKESDDVETPSPRLFIIDFDGDIRASAVEELRQEVSAVLTAAQPTDEVLVRLESGGGVVHGYGLAASQLKRIRDRGISLTVAVDKVAASGGYMMACVADKIICAPFAIIGSIGVIMQMPNFHQILKKNDVEYEQIQGGEFKRTLTMFGENTDAARDKAQQEIDDTHQLFKGFVLEHRPGLDIDQVATGEHWFGSQALELKLVDEIITSDDYLMNKRTDSAILEVGYHEPETLKDKLSGIFSSSQAHIEKQMQDNKRPWLL